MKSNKYTRLLLACLIFTNRCISHSQCRTCSTNAFNDNIADAVCLADSKYLTTLKTHLGPIMYSCRKNCDFECEYFNDNISRSIDPCLVSTTFCKMCGNKPRIQKEEYK